MAASAPPYFKVHAENQPAFLFLGFVVRDIALLLEDAGNLGLQLRSRNIQLLMTRPDCVPDARQKIGYWVGQTHSFSFIPRSLPGPLARNSEENLQECLPAVYRRPSQTCRKHPRLPSATSST